MVAGPLVQPKAGCPMEHFRELVVNDVELHDRLLATGDRAGFVALVVEVAGGRGLVITPGEVEAALVSARRAWLSRWV
ncbi:MAG: hypothetical protein ABR511_02135 [Acidimicrobiales bacterium]